MAESCLRLASRHRHKQYEVQMTIYDILHIVLKRLRVLMKVDLRIQRLYVSVLIKIVASNNFYVKDLCQLYNKTMLNAAAMIISEAEGNVKMKSKIFSIQILRSLLPSIISSVDSSYWSRRTTCNLSEDFSKELATLFRAKYTNILASYTYATGRTEHGLCSL
jgi:hypothetical protein